MHITPYLNIARPDHWFKNVFMLPGTVLAIFVTDTPLSSTMFINVFLAIASACLIASANYSINEWLDSDYDKHHPTKKERPSVKGQVNALGVYIQWLVLLSSGLYIASKLGSIYLATSLLFVLMGVIYNVRPFRSKERIFVDVLTEAVNNPIRLLLGWFVISDDLIPPSSLIVAYWMIGAFLMAIKRYAELREIDDHSVASRYRASFKKYTDQSLLLSAVFYALMAAFLLGVFMIKYRIEYLLAIPFVAFLFIWYLALGLNKNSIVQTPEKLYTKPLFMLYLALVCLIIAFLSAWEIPALSVLLQHVTIS